MSKHTPGPWAMDGDILLTHADPFEAHPFGRLNISHAFTEDEREANRALVLGAPDMFDALIDVRRALELANFTGELAVVDSAIARAKGESA